MSLGNSFCTESGCRLHSTFIQLRRALITQLGNNGCPNKRLILLLEAVKPLLSFSAIILHIPPSWLSQRWQMRHACVCACDSKVLYFLPRRPSTELQTSDRTRPGGAPGAWKKGAGPNPRPGFTQTATYNRQIWSSALQHTSEALSLPALSLPGPVRIFLGFFLLAFFYPLLFTAAI